MGNHKNAQLIIILLSLGTLLIVSLACDCPPTNPPPKVKPPVHPKPPPKVKPPVHPKPPPKVKPPVHPKPPPKSHVKPPPVAKPPPKPPVVKPPPTVPKPPPKPPVVQPPTIPKTPPPSPSPPSPSPPSETCPIDTLKLSGCVDVLGGLVQIVIGQSAKDECCPVLEGLVGLDAALCLCTTIKAKLLNINILLPIALQLLVDCGKNPPSGFQCPS